MKVNYKLKTEPYAHQMEALSRSITEDKFAFFMEMGTGKSKVLIDTIATIAGQDRIRFAFIIAPKGVYRNWVEKEIPEHFSDEVLYRVFYWQSKKTKAYEKDLKEFFRNDDPGVRIFVMNIEAFSSLRGKNIAQWITTRFGFQGLIAIDESTTIKNSTAKRTKVLIKLAPLFKYRRLLTGSPVTKAPMDLFSQCEFLEPGLLGYESYYSFMHRFAVLRKIEMGAHSFQKVVGYRNMDELTRKIDEFSYRVLKKDCLDLPEKTYTVRYVPMSPEQLSMYMDLQKEAVLLLDNGELVTAMQVMTQMLRVQQILSGHVKTDDGEMIEVPTKRLDALLECIEESSGKILIWSRFRYDIIKITAALNKAYGEGSAAAYFGDTPDDERQRIVKEFQSPLSDLRFFVGNPATAGYGLTLTEASTVIYYANDFNLETRIQSEDRCHRIGQKNPVTYIDLISEGTIDEKIVGSLRNKIDIGAKVLGEEARKWLTLNPKS